VHARLFDVTAREISDADRLAASWGNSTPLFTPLRRAAVGVVAAVITWYVRVREHSSSLWVSDTWLAEHERQSSKHEGSI
jgi:hypothetical protein